MAERPNRRLDSPPRFLEGKSWRNGASIVVEYPNLARWDTLGLCSEGTSVSTRRLGQDLISTGFQKDT
jgi:hypothetical protein